MTQFVDVPNMARWIAETGPAACMEGILGYLEEDYLRWEGFEKIPRIASHTPFGVIELMPASNDETYGFKYVNGHPGNPSRGYQTVTAFGVLADVHNGYPTFLAEMTLLTALRTAATSVLAARALARPDSRVMALIGTGSQSEFQALAFQRCLGIDTIRLYDIDPDAIAKCVRNLLPSGLKIEVAGSAAEAAEGADIVTTCTADKSLATILYSADIGPGVHLNAIGGDCPGKTELEPALVARSRVFVEYAPQTFIEGEIQRQSPDFPVTELWEVLAGRRSGRTSAAEVTLFDSVGFAIEDFSALRYLRDAVAGTSRETDIELVAAPDDPKDLFGMLGVPSPVA